MLNDAEADDSSLVGVYAAGFNAFGQLLSDVRGDGAYRKLPISTTDSRIVFTGWSTTVIHIESHIFGHGNVKWDQALPDNCTKLHSAFGDHNGLSGVLDHLGRLYVVEDINSSQHIVVARGQETEGLHPIAHIAMASNGHVSAVMQEQSPTNDICRVVQFPSLSSFLCWYRGMLEDFTPPTHYNELLGSALELVANTAGFVLLMQSGQVYTWGDPRHQSLARSVADQDACPADQPGEVIALGGLQIAKIAAGGWMAAALCRDGALYLWGANTPGRDGQLEVLRGLGPDEVALVQLTDSEDQDVIRVSIGENHVAVITQSGAVFVAGENRDGQLGLQISDVFHPGWVQVPRFRRAREVLCGPKCTIVWA
ncbi:RCC1/BLIP-II [Dissoconium aciculare CBS 342.82]|uniref:RCC1/BLIP-II n=1 Tax=Dissoconium aciculare CBS 342.82 TaxID=1314786 RepID=A0A6J3M279_9PEZI|nr:RCC1/BLIP-II [Dissoconium aciculare CBS 342.82]KAF1821032.1 RCC1/BLIP-II [Dissoconium aciculare CBS 342.82]